MPDFAVAADDVFATPLDAAAAAASSSFSALPPNYNHKRGALICCYMLMAGFKIFSLLRLFSADTLMSAPVIIA